MAARTSIRDTPLEEPIDVGETNLPGERQEIGGLDQVIRPRWPNPVSFVDDPEDPFSYDMGTKFVGTIVDGRPYQARDAETKEPMFWPSGDPLMVLVIIALDASTGEDCSVFIQGRELTAAFSQALTVAKVKGIAPGDLLEVTWSGEHETVADPKKAARRSRVELSATKEYEVVLTPMGS